MAACDIDVLANQGLALGFGALDDTQLISAKMFLMADTIFDLSGGTIDYRDLHALTESIEKFHGVPNYAAKAARLYAWGEIHRITVGQPPDWDQVRAGIRDCHCWDAGHPCLENAFTFLLCTLVELIEP